MNSQWIEPSTGVQEFMGSIPVGDSDLFFVPRLRHVDQFIINISLPSLKFNIFIYLSSFPPFILSSKGFTL